MSLDNQQNGDTKAEAYVQVNGMRIGMLRLLGDNLDGVNPSPVAFIIFQLEEQGRFGSEAYPAVIAVHRATDLLIAPLYAYSSVTTFVYAVSVSSRIRDPQGFLVAQAHILEAAIEKELNECRLQAKEVSLRSSHGGSNLDPLMDLLMGDLDDLIGFGDLFGGSNRRRRG